ncbi:MAG: nucleotidyltransferase domain-containing protein [Thermoflexales bacterium]|nr:nucleotidyltransferase domain-containing protein [Thermoflexales bacterium]
MRASTERYAQLRAEAQRIASQLAALGAVRVVLFGSLARGEVSLGSDIDLLAIFDAPRSPRELNRWVYQQIDAREAVDLIAHSRQPFSSHSSRPFWRHALRNSEVLYERPEA